MANILTGLIPVMYEALDTVAREPQGFVKNVQLDAQASTAAVGQTVRSYVAPATTVSDITPGQIASATGGQTIGYVDLTLTRQKKAELLWTGEEMKAVNGQFNSILKDQFAQAFRALSNLMENDLAQAAIAGASRAYGTAGTTPFGTSGDLSDAANIQRILDENGAPTGDRHLVLSTASLANLRGKQSVLFKVNEAGTSDLLRQGVIGQLEGLNLHTALGANMAHTTGTGAGYLVNGATAAGATSLVVKTGSGTINSGDFITIAGDSNKYVVNTGVAAPGTATLANPGLMNAATDGAAVTLGGSYTANVAFHKNALVLAARAPAMPIGGDAASDVTYVTDAVSGLTFQVAVYQMYRQIKIEIGLVWGFKVVKSEFIATLLG